MPVGSIKSYICRETFSQVPSSIRVQPSFGVFWDSKSIARKKPRGGSRGAIDTQSFRARNQEVEVSSSGGYSSPCLCVNSTYLQTAPSADSLLERN